MRLPFPFIRLPFSFDAGRLEAELETVSASAWMAHPSGLVGNSAVALVSYNGGDNNVSRITENVLRRFAERG